MSDFIPKEKLTAYQRWEVAAFDEDRKVTAESPPAARQAEDQPLAAPPVETASEQENPSPEPPLVLPTAEAIETMHREAHEAGYAAGYQEGIAAAQSSAEAISTLMDNLQQALAGIDQTVAEQLLALAIEVASQVLRQSLKVQPELLLPVVREAVTTLHPHHGQPLLFIHPVDAALVRGQLGDQLAHVNWRIVEDATLTPGGCRVELGASEVDASLETRWRRVIENIGISQDWLEAQAGETNANAGERRLGSR
ncbi:MAG: flagellar assembly protein FliH [Candidatus Accumulibacter sp.]|uniref:flagellar assembly protein FliH n=1 Tax=Accumulibacter sp. TaxID=2053492 RepID=UPI0019EECEF2|nr:flagellar assembly protein FliH [Accumulibacter sp.]MBE2258493.1 flagellar assembly protein FliH [Paracoccaceae bacterium]MCB1940552.1 flagellar assembly protein FliH [Accumulibacter sp.]MCP5249157.1 flagellar assembly protein FliH [Accumulibacter sp.]